jgi:hypothetical protein
VRFLRELWNDKGLGSIERASSPDRWGLLFNGQKTDFQLRAEWVTLRCIFPELIPNIALTCKDKIRSKKNTRRIDLLRVGYMLETDSARQNRVDTDAISG